MDVIATSLICAERAVQAVFADDLGDRPLYIVQPTAGGMITPAMLGGKAGVYCRGLDVALRPELESENRWMGPGVAFVLDAWWIFVNAANDDEGRRSVVGAALHEMCHYVDHGGDPVDIASGHYDQIVDKLNKLSSPPEEVREFPLDFLNHDESFCRIAAHAWYRSQRVGGVLVSPRDMRFGSAYAGLEYLPSPVEIIDAITAELESYRGSLSELSALDPPGEYADLWDQVLLQHFAAPAA